MRITITLLLSSLFTLNYAQDNREESKFCGTEINSRQIELVQERTLRTPVSRMLDGSLVNIAITPHILRRSDGTGGLSEGDFNAALQNVNDYYLNAGMAFFVLGDINYIDDDGLYDFSTGSEGAMGAANDVTNTINIYFANSVGNGAGSFYCGYTTFPGGPDRILMDNSCAINGSTLPHEIGHYFTLYHTHGKTNTGTTDELVDGTNCSTAGDDICDTPADPNLSGNVDGSCNYTGTATDANGAEYIPNTHNIMSYSRKNCRDFFSEGQFDRIFSGYNNFRTYLISTEYFANFVPTNKTTCVGSSITFESTSVGAASYSWTFEGGNPATSDLQNPVVTYDNIGSFDVTLTITTDDAETDEKISLDAIEIIETQLSVDMVVADFETSEVEQYSIINSDNDITFEASTLASKSLDRSMYLDFYNYNSQGEQDYLILDDLTPGKNYELKFFYAYTYYSDDFQDRLEVISRASCTEEWESIWDYSGADLATAPSTTSQFVPTSDQWREVIIPLTFDTENKSMQLAFRATSGYGNSLFIDNINVSPELESIQVSEVITEDESCFGSNDGTITIAASQEGETISYSLDDANYQESGVFDGLDAAEYSVYIKSTSGDSRTMIVAVNEPELLVLQADVQNPTCPESQDGSVELSSTGGVGEYSYSFNGENVMGTNIFGDLPVGTVTVSVEDVNGCTSEENVNLVADNPSPLVPVITYDSDLGLLQISPTPFNIQWFHDSEILVENGSTNSLNSIGPGFYQVTLTSDAGCESISEPFTIASLYDSFEDNFQLYPSPSSSTVHLTSEKAFEKDNIKIIDQQGRVHTLTSIASPDGITVNVSTLKPGVYIIQLTMDEHLFSRKIIVK